MTSYRIFPIDSTGHVAGSPDHVEADTDEEAIRLVRSQLGCDETGSERHSERHGERHGERHSERHGERHSERHSERLLEIWDRDRLVIRLAAEAGAPE